MLPQRMADTRTPRKSRVPTLLCIAVLLVLCGLCAIVFFQYPQVMNTITTISRKTQPNHVIVVGSGLAGLTASLEAVSHGAKVTIIEKEKNLGGNSAKATSGINGVGTKAQESAGITDSIDEFMKDVLQSGGGRSDPELVRTLADNSAAAIEFLRSRGLNLTDVIQLGGHTHPRTHRFPSTPEGKAVPVGWTIVSTLRKAVETELYEKITVKSQSLFKGLVIEEGKVKGVQYEGQGEMQTLHGVVVFASGGYANDHATDSLLQRFTPEFAKYPTTNGPWATGDVIKATEVNTLGLVDMDKVQVHPTGFIDAKDPNAHTKFLAPEALRGCGAILLSSEVKRFANELGRRDYLTQKIMENCRPFGGVEGNPIAGTMLLNQAAIDRFSAPLAGFYIFKGLIRDVKDIQGAADELKVTKDVLLEALFLYNKQAASQKDEFGKTVFPVVFQPEDHYYIAYITPTLHYCMGGIQFNSRAQVLQIDPAEEREDETGDASTVSPLPGLYAAGEVTGGLHGNNRLGGNSLLECVVFGRIAGYHAAHYNP